VGRGGVAAGGVRAPTFSDASRPQNTHATCETLLKEPSVASQNDENPL
jgi:hypothetical protein